MARRVTALFVVLFALVIGGALLTGLINFRAAADREYAKNALRELCFAAGDHTRALEGQPPGAGEPGVPAATVPNARLAADARLSWVVPALPLFNAKRQDPGPVAASVRRDLAWDADENQAPGRTVLKGLICPAKVPGPAPGGYAVTQFVGVAGVGADAAGLPAESPKAGAFSHAGPTPFRAFADGLSQTLLFAETDDRLGPWLRGGFSTARGVEPAPALIGPGQQFGGVHAKGAYFATADGAVNFWHADVDPRIVLSLATRAGGAAEFAPAD